MLCPNDLLIISGEVTVLFDKSDVFLVRRDIQKIIGSKVKLETNKGRHKSVISRGIVANVYPNIFTVQLFEGTDPSRKLSFSYTDVLTNTVEITLCE
ncbi:MAG: Veg family protein [Defluviitaleaceae bacterium]|nr:Veg family protein [Defluviitaleaceae bacterium]